MNAFCPSRRQFSVMMSMMALSPLQSCSEKTNGTILYVTLELGNPFYTSMIEGIQSRIGVGNKWNLDTRAGKSATDVSGQIDILESYLSQHNKKGGFFLSGLVFVPAQSGPELTDVIRRYNEAKIPIINVDIPIEPSVLERTGAKIEGYIGSDNLAGGQKAGELLATKLSEGGQVLILNGASGSANAQRRRNGFIQGLTSNSTGSKKFDITEWNCNWSPSEAATATESVLTTSNSLKGIFAANDVMALGAVQAVNSFRRGNRAIPLIVGYDATPDAVTAIKEGNMYASISQNPRTMGERSIEYLEKLAAGSAIPSTTIIPVSPVVSNG